MKKLITVALLGLSVSGLALANDRAGDFSQVEPSSSQPYTGQQTSRHSYPTPAPSRSSDDVAEFRVERGNGRG